MHKVIKLAFVIIFFVIIFLPVLLSDKTGGGKSVMENRMLAKAPTFADLSIKSFNNWIQDNIGFREKCFQLKSLVELKIFNKSFTDKVVIGKGNYYFYNDFSNIEIALGKYPFTEQEYVSLSSNLIDISDYLNKHNIPFIYLMPPTKTSIFPEYIRGYNLKRIETPVDILETNLNGRIKYINLKDFLYKQKEQQNIDKLYWYTDTHWTYYGAYISYLNIIEKLNQWNINDKDIEPVQVDYKDEQRLGDLASMLGGENIVNKEMYKQTVIKNVTFIKQDLEETLLKIQAEQKGSQIYSYINPKSSNKLNVLCLGDSMFGSWNIPELFAQTFYKYTYGWNVHLSKELIEYIKPDIIIFSPGERTLKYSVYSRIENYLKEIGSVSGNSINKVENNIENKKTNILSVNDALKTVNSDTLLFNFDMQEYKNNTLILQGWLYDKSDSATGNVFIRIKDGSNNIKEYAAQMQQRPDVVKYFNNDKLINSGFIVNIPVDGGYEIQDLILEKNGAYYSISAVKNDNKNASKNIEIKDTIAEDNITFGIDKNEYKNNILTIQGWVYDKSDSATGNVFIRIKDGSNNIKVYAAQIQQRPDVVQYFNNEKLINSGFQADIKIDNNYQILDIIFEKEGKYFSKPMDIK